MAKLELLKQVTERTGTRDTGTVTIKTIPIGQISARQNLREHDTCDIDDLKESIKTVGLIQPITVCKDGEDYLCIIGHRRLRAYRELYKENKDQYHSIQAIITDDKNIIIRQLIENVQRVDLKPIELYHALKKLRQEGLTIKQIAGILGKAEGYIKNLFSGIKEIESDPDNMEILKKSRGVTLQDFSEIRAIKDKTIKKSLIKQRAEKNITRNELRNKTVKKETSRLYITEFSDIEARFIRRALNHVLKKLAKCVNGYYSGTVKLSKDEFQTLDKLCERMNKA
ncbi:MAG: ParB/RepB/Spo0J family partition protein [Spirochaetes bacterium]|nr:ParB/RepB/Spo0J family partition protein [Spirochaetota bacterium]